MLASSNAALEGTAIHVSSRRALLPRMHIPPVRPYPEDILSSVVQASKHNSQWRIREPACLSAVDVGGSWAASDGLAGLARLR